MKVDVEYTNFNPYDFFVFIKNPIVLSKALDIKPVTFEDWCNNIEIDVETEFLMKYLGVSEWPGIFFNPVNLSKVAFLLTSPYFESS